ncbi:MAG TPA: hypothetical protein VNZ22_19135 [Bacillota bacterium]|nr:hypothetical protein [Bacillota bacterium]
MSITIVPWLLAVATAVWFGLMAQRTGRSRILWAVGGLVLGLIVATCLFGVAQAASIPFSDAERLRLHIEWTVAAIALIAAIGWLFTLRLHHRRLGPATSAASPPAKPSAPSTPAAPGKQPDTPGKTPPRA